MALIGKLLSKRLGPLLGDSQNNHHGQQQQQHHHQDPYYGNPHQNAYLGPYNYTQPPMNAGYHHMSHPPMQRPPVVGRKAEKHYRRAERTMQRAEHRAERDIRRAERDMRKAERRGDIPPFGQMMHQQPPAIGGHGYSNANNGYQMRDAGYEQQYQSRQQQDAYLPELETRSLDCAGPSTRRPEDVPPPAYSYDDGDMRKA
ncbi:hypothetical protein B0T10DRAFT_452986 [Thelonectria olida]|uniref:Uncharacterized protein n=1 Tax=Thelonectria olida TaxID=1576542 RepID=A0A9P8WL78_9HYPO|nr:hypothetical protein B0T10DRAFT_452986 [Thelonectria olida]